MLGYGRVCVTLALCCAVAASDCLYSRLLDFCVNRLTTADTVVLVADLDLLLFLGTELLPPATGLRSLLTLRCFICDFDRTIEAASERIPKQFLSGTRGRGQGDIPIKCGTKLR